MNTLLRKSSAVLAGVIIGTALTTVFYSKIAGPGANMAGFSETSAEPEPLYWVAWI